MPLHPPWCCWTSSGKVPGRRTGWRCWAPASNICADGRRAPKLWWPPTSPRSFGLPNGQEFRCGLLFFLFFFCILFWKSLSHQLSFNPELLRLGLVSETEPHLQVSHLRVLPSDDATATAANSIAYLYQLVPGCAEKSFGLDCARKAGLDSEVGQKMAWSSNLWVIKLDQT